MPEAKPKVIEAIGLTKEFFDFWKRPKATAVAGIDFGVPEGEVFGLLGPNGSGKSTTLKMILGLLYPSRGALSVFGKNPRDVQTKMRIGYLPEESYLYKYLTALETLDFFGALFNLSGLERRKRSEQLLDMVGLSHARNRPVGEFSKGMMRRIGLAQAIINDPDLVILDEPTSGLDPLGCKEIKDLIRHLKSRGKTVVISSHLLSDVEDLCDEVIILYGGKIRASGRIEELLTISNASRIITPLLSPELGSKVAALLKEGLGDDFRIDHPRRSLEEFFIDVVNKARQEKASTSGVEGGGGIAQYLRKPSDEIIRQLAEPEPETQKEPPAPKEEITDEAKIKIEKLVDHGGGEPIDAAEKEDLGRVDEKLSKLLGGDKGGKH